MKVPLPPSCRGHVGPEGFSLTLLCGDVLVLLCSVAVLVVCYSPGCCFAECRTSTHISGFPLIYDLCGTQYRLAR
jgi:hypothetical protein